MRDAEVMLAIDACNHINNCGTELASGVQRDKLCAARFSSLLMLIPGLVLQT